MDDKVVIEESIFQVARMARGEEIGTLDFFVDLQDSDLYQTLTDETKEQVQKTMRYFGIDDESWKGK